MSHLWDKPGVPHKGWEAVATPIDHGDYRITCEMCDREDIRWGHQIAHDDYPEILEVGCVCAEKLVHGYVGGDAVKSAKKRERWVESRWTHYKDKSFSAKDLVDDRITIFKSDSGYAFSANRPALAGKIYSTKNYPTFDDAKRAAWQMYYDQGWL